MASLQYSPRGRNFLNGLDVQVKALKKATAARESEAAIRATKVSRDRFVAGLGHRPLAPPRPGRPTSEGLFPEYINWFPIKGHNTIQFDTVYLESKAPYWLIQEIGTGHSAAIGNVPNSTIKTKATVSVRSQEGRAISPNLIWATGPGAPSLAGIPSRQKTQKDAAGKSVPGNDQLFPASFFSAQSLVGLGRKKKRIRREIKAKNYLQSGGVVGFRYLESNLVADAEKIFK